MKKFNKEAKSFVLGCCFTATILIVYLFFTNNLPFMRAAGVGTGAADINAKYHDGYATSLTAGASKVYVSDANGYLPQVVPTGMISMFDTNCPSGWTRVTALDGKFLVGGSSYSAAAGGSDSITLTTSNMPAHTHTGTTASSGAHTHNLEIKGSSWPGSQTKLFSKEDDAHIVDEATGEAGAHTHTFTTDSTGSGTAFDNRPAYATIVICKKD